MQFHADFTKQLNKAEWAQLNAAERSDWPKLEIAVQRLLSDDWARSVLERIEAGDRLLDFDPKSEWRRLIDVADLTSILDIPKLGLPIHWWMTSPVIVAARKMLVLPSGTLLDPEYQKLLLDGIFPSILYKPALNDRHPANFVLRYYWGRRWYLSTLLPAWADYAKNEDIGAITRDLEEELNVTCDLNGEAAGRADDLLWPYLVHHGVVSGPHKMFVIPFAMDKAGVDVRDIGAMQKAISDTPHWQSVFREYNY